MVHAIKAQLDAVLQKVSLANVSRYPVTGRLLHPVTYKKTRTDGPSPGFTYEIFQVWKSETFYHQYSSSQYTIYKISFSNNADLIFRFSNHTHW